MLSQTAIEWTQFPLNTTVCSIIHNGFAVVEPLFCTHLPLFIIPLKFKWQINNFCRLPLLIWKKIFSRRISSSFVLRTDKMSSLCLLQNLSKTGRGVSLLRRCSAVAGTSSAGSHRSKDEIVIPKRIERSSTDILYALAATVGRDPTAPHYKYHDDPYLIPTTNLNKRAFAMAQESGRKAAKWIKEKHWDLFMVNIIIVFIVSSTHPCNLRM